MAPYTTIDDPSAYFKIQLYSGTGSSNAQTFADTATDMQPDLVWVKERSYADHHMLADAARGATVQLYVNENWVEETQAEGLKSFDSDGFTVGTRNNWNRSSNTFVAWCWKTQGGAGSSNTDGSINTTTTSVNTTSKFSISTYTGTGSAGTIGHGLGVTPSFIIFKTRNDTNWFGVYLKSGGDVHTGYDSLLYLNSSNGIAASQEVNIAPTSSVIAFSDNEQINKSSSENYVMYAWSAVQGYSKFGEYIANTNAEGPFIYTGFRPRMVIIKMTVTGDGWGIWDSERSPINVTDSIFQANSSGAESGSNAAYKIDFLSNGFKIRSNNAQINHTSYDPYIYMAFAEAPLVNSNGVPCNAR